MIPQEHHLQRAISAQQIYGGGQRLIIPTPDAILYDSDYKKLKQRNVHMPKQLIHVQAFTLEDELPDYDCDDQDEEWLELYNKKNKDHVVDLLEFERVIDTLEKSCSSRIDLFTISDAKALVKKDEKIVKAFYEYWKEKRLKKGLNLAPIVRTEKKDGSALHDPYVAFRRRIEKMQTRKNRKNDESSYEKMLKLRRDLNRACLILEMVKQREEKKRGLLQTTVKILESRYTNKDFSGELMHQCYDLLKHRQVQHDQKPTPLSTSNNNLRESGDPKRRSDIEEQQKKRHKLLKQRAAMMSTTDETGITDSQHTTHPTHSQADARLNEGPDGKFTFIRKKDVIYHAPRYDSVGNWPWTHPVEGGLSSSNFSYSRTSIQKRCCCIGFARRRVGRGGRINFDRAYTPYDCVNGTKDCKNNLDSPDSKSPLTNRVPPWPHFKPQHDSSSSDDEHDNLETLGKTSQTKWLGRDSTVTSSDPTNHVFTKPSLYRSFSSQPTSRFRIHPYPSRTVNQTQKHSSSINNQVFIASLAASFSKNADSQHWILRRSRNNHHLYSNSIFTSPKKGSMPHQMTLSPSRPASTAPASAIYQLNFPISTATPTASKSNSVTSSLSNTNNNNNTILRAVVKASSATGSLPISHTSSDTSIARVQLATSSIQTTISRQPLSIVQQPSLITAQKIIPQTAVSATQGSLLQVQPVVNNVRANKLNIPKGLTINHSTVVTNGITQPQSIQLAR